VIIFCGCTEDPIQLGSVGGALDCDDGNGCTVDSVSGDSCAHYPLPAGTLCSDGDNIGLCSVSSCVLDPTVDPNKQHPRYPGCIELDRDRYRVYFEYCAQENEGATAAAI